MVRGIGRAKWVAIGIVCVAVAAAAGFVFYKTVKKPVKTAMIVSSQGFSAGAVSQTVSRAAASSAPVSFRGNEPVLADKFQKNISGVYISTGPGADFPAAAGNAAAQQAALQKMAGDVSGMKLNTIFFEARQASDAYYASSFYPWAASLTGTQGKNPGYDPLDTLVRAAHAKNIRVDVRINPYFVGKAGQAFADTSPAKLHPDWTVVCGGNVYLNPGIPNVNELVANGIEEIVKQYNVDGVLLSGGFYPSGTFDDTAAFEKYNASVLSLSAWRKANVDALLKLVSSKIKAADKSVQLGVEAAQTVSAAGTAQAGTTLFGDVAGWARGGLIDYICPMVSDTLGAAPVSFENAATLLTNDVKGTNVSLYIIHSAYKAGSSGWQSPDQLIRQVVYASKLAGCCGSVYDGYGSLLKNTGGIKDTLVSFYSGKLNLATLGKPLVVNEPKDGTVTDQGYVKISGTSDSNFPLLLNGKPLGCDAEGQFSRTCGLNPGVNTFTLNHKGVTRRLTVQYKVVVLKSVGPAKDITADGGTQVSITATAKNGSTVTASIAGKSYTLTQSVFSGNDNAAEQTGITDYCSYSVLYTLPASQARVQDLGKVKITATWGKFSASALAADIKVTAKAVASVKGTGKIIVSINKSTPYTETYLYSDNMYRPVTYPQLPGSWDYIETNSDGSPKVYYGGNYTYYKMSNGELIYTSDSNLSRGAKPANRISSASQTQYDGDRYTRFTLKFSQKITYNAGIDVQYPSDNKPGVRDYTVSNFNASVFKITFFNTSSAVKIGKINSPLISSVDCVSVGSNQVQYVFHFKNKGVFYGTYINYDASGNMVIDFLNPWDGDLSNLRIAIDAGHGGKDPGAVFAAGVHPTEADLNLKYILLIRSKLEKMGVPDKNIYLTRTNDTYPDYMNRVHAMINFRPNFTLCIHQNAYDGTATGVESYYYQPFSQPFVASIQNAILSAYQSAKKMPGVNVYSGMGANRGARFCSAVAYYSCKQIQMPSTLIECGFIDNANEYQFLKGDAGADAITTGIINGSMAFLKGQVKYADGAGSPSQGTGTSGGSSLYESSLAALPPEADSTTVKQGR